MKVTEFGVVKKLRKRREELEQQKLITKSLRDSLEAHVGDGDTQYNLQGLEAVKASMELEDQISGKKSEKIDPRVLSSIISGLAALGVAGISYVYGIRLCELEDKGGIVPTRKLGFGRFQIPRP